MTSPSALTINVAAVVIRNARGEVLCVRKHSSPRFQLPGGKPEAGESMVEAALRETREEVGVDVEREALSFLGRFSAEASNEPGHTVTSAVSTARAYDGAPAHARAPTQPAASSRSRSARSWPARASRSSTAGRSWGLWARWRVGRRQATAQPTVC